jgi:hypothetical protein
MATIMPMQTVTWSSGQQYAIKTMYSLPSDQAFFACPVVTNAGTTYIATNINHQPTKGLAPGSDSAWTVYVPGGGGGSGVTSLTLSDGNGFNFSQSGTTGAITASLAPSFTGFAYSDGTTLQTAGTDGTGTNIALTGSATSWTPTLTCATPGDLAILYNTQTGSFVRIGNLIIATFNIIASNFTFSTASGNVIIGGTGSLPGTPSFPLTSFGSISIGNYTKSGYAPGSTILNSSGLQIIMTGSGNASVNMAITDFSPPAPPSIQGTIIYFIA